MVALVIAEHDNASLKGSTLHTVTAAAQCGVSTRADMIWMQLQKLTRAQLQTLWQQNKLRSRCRCFTAYHRI